MFYIMEADTEKTRGYADTVEDAEFIAKAFENGKKIKCIIRYADSRGNCYMVNREQ